MPALLTSTCTCGNSSSARARQSRHILWARDVGTHSLDNLTWICLGRHRLPGLVEVRLAPRAQQDAGAGRDVRVGYRKSQTLAGSCDHGVATCERHAHTCG